MYSQVFGDDMQAKLYAPIRLPIDPNIAVMLLIAIATVFLGGYWSGACERWAITAALNRFVCVYLNTINLDQVLEECVVF